MAIEHLELLSAGTEVRRISYTAAVGKPLLLSAALNETVGSPKRGVKEYSLGKVNGITPEGVEVFRREIDGKSNVLTRVVIPWVDLESGAALRRVISSSRE